MISPIQSLLAAVDPGGDGGGGGGIGADFGGGIQPAVRNEYTQGAAQGDNAFSIVALVISNIIGVITVLGGLFFIVYFFMGAFSWITAGDDSGAVEKARTKMMNGVLGLIVMIISYSLIGIVGRVVGLDLINIEKTLSPLNPGL